MGWRLNGGKIDENVVAFLMELVRRRLPHFDRDLYCISALYGGFNEVDGGFKCARVDGASVVAVLQLGVLHFDDDGIGIA